MPTLPCVFQELSSAGHIAYSAGIHCFACLMRKAAQVTALLLCQIIARCARVFSTAACHVMQWGSGEAEAAAAALHEAFPLPPKRPMRLTWSVMQTVCIGRGYCVWHVDWQVCVAKPQAALLSDAGLALSLTLWYV